MPSAIEGAHRLALAPDVFLTLVFGDAHEQLPCIDAEIDAWFLDGFAPAKNPDLWTPEIFSELARLSKAGATAATFTVAGEVRRALTGAGFSVEKRPGFGRKREMLTARLDASSKATRRAPWFANAGLRRLAQGARVAVIGGGVAGASLAHELQRAGLEPTIIDPAGIATGASGNPAGLLMPRLDLGDDRGSRFFRAAYVHALRTIEALQARSGERFFNPRGVLLKAKNDEERERHRKILTAKLLPDDFILEHPEGLFFPQAGVIDPPNFCASLAEGAKILRRRALSLEARDGAIILALDGEASLEFDAAIIANGRDALRFVAARSLPLSGVMGQIDYFSDVTPPEHAVAFGPYAAPAPQGGVVIGATYEKIAAGEPARTSASATRENIDAVAAVLPELATALDEKDSHPRAAIRCQTPDRLPVAGPRPDWNFYGAAYDDLRLGRQRDYPPGEVAPGLFILSGLGSRGFVTAPYAASLMVAEMTGAPFEREIAEALHPARFFIRDLKRPQRIAAT
jgi:tRNA 5-methylaminomethyl-2-thiouridine biosynthesis bifunctional protein